MNHDILFIEKQKYTQWWLWLVMIIINCVLVFIMGVQILGGQPVGNHPMSDVNLIALTMLCLILMILVFTVRLETTIKKDGVYIRFFPFQFSTKYYSWDDIESIYVRQYNSLMEFGGWGYRIGVFGNGKLYNVSGNMGLQIEFKNKKKLLVGTKNPNELAAVLEQLGKA